MTRKQLNVAALYAALDLIRAHGELSWRDVAKATGCSPSTFSRLALGSKPDADALCTLVAWLRVPLDRFTTDADDTAPALAAVTPADTAEVRAIVDGPARDGAAAELEGDA